MLLPLLELELLPLLELVLLPLLEPAPLPLLELEPPLVPEASRAAAISTPIGDPSPVHASQPGPAENDPLFPEVMSWNALGEA